MKKFRIDPGFNNGVCDVVLKSKKELAELMEHSLFINQPLDEDDIYDNAWFHGFYENEMKEYDEKGEYPFTSI